MSLADGMMADATGKVVGVKIDHRALAGCPVLPLLGYELYGLVSFFFPKQLAS